MDKKSAFASPTLLVSLSLFAEVIAIAILCVLFSDNFQHSFLFFFLYLLMFMLVLKISSSFKSGKKELMKISIASLFTICFVFHAMAFVDILSLNYYYFFTNNYFATIIGLIAIVLFFLFTFAYFKHFSINSSNESKTKDVIFNKKILLSIGILSLIQAAIIAYNDYSTGRDVEFYLILSYVLFFFISFILICVETLINEFRLAREEGNLQSYAKKIVGAKAAKEATVSEKTTKPITKNGTVSEKITKPIDTVSKKTTKPITKKASKPAVKKVAKKSK